jgi:hypothetical protein
MKTITTLAALTAFAFLGACSSTQNTSAPGAVGTKSSECCKSGSSCSKDQAAAAPGAVGEKKEGCCAGKSDCSAAKSAPGAVSGKSECSATSGGCAAKCPATKG